ncbi:MAG: CinA family protein [Proteobacteria bacterium]|nr:CinA family protein [Pseudomonadota bacterium]
MFTDDQKAQAEAVLDACREAGLRLAVAESCTGGLITGCLTAVAGSSDVVERGFVVYTNEAKRELLGVPAALFDDGAPGAVSEEVARAMAEGALQHSNAQIGVAVTGIAGPGGGTEGKPVGLVHIACARDGAETLHESHVFDGGRDAVRMQSVAAALALVRCRVGE